MISRFGLIFGLALTLAACGSNDGSASANEGGIHPPDWIQGKWQGGSPTVLHLTFTADQILDEDGKNALPGYREVGADATSYMLTNDSSGWSSLFSQKSATRMNWVITTPSDSVVTAMTKK